MYLVIISPENGPKLDDRLVGEILSPIPRAHRSKSVTWLKTGKACEILLYVWDHGSSEVWEDKHDMLDFIDHNVISVVRQKYGVDAAVVPERNRAKKLLIADMDSTIIQQECIDELAEFAGKRAEISAITERAMRGELDFEAALKERVAMLKGLPESVLAETFEKRIILTPGAQTLVKTMNARGAVTALVSGGFTYFTGRVAEKTGFRINQANELFVSDGKLTGTVREPILGRAAKQEALERIARENSIDLGDTLAVGDGANDLSMLARSGLGVAFHAKPAVAEAAAVQINHADLTALLYLQGIPQSEFAD